MNPSRIIKAGTILRADYFWKNEPKADGKARNCVVIATAGRRAIICPITSLSERDATKCRRIDDRLKRGIDGLGDDKESWINLAEQNIVYLDGPRLYRNKASKGGDARIHGQLSEAMSESLAKEAISLKVKPANKQVESDWKEDVIRLKGREAVATMKSKARASDQTREERVKAAAEARHRRQQGGMDQGSENQDTPTTKPLSAEPER